MYVTERIVTFYKFIIFMNQLILTDNNDFIDCLIIGINHNVSSSIIPYLSKEMLKIFKSKLLIIECKNIEFNSGFNNCTFRYN